MTTVQDIAAAARAPVAASPRPGHLMVRRFLAHPAAVLGLVVLVLLALACLAAPLVEAWLGVDAEAVSLFDRYLPPSSAHPLGTDELGRDVLVRLLYGGRVSLFVGLMAAAIAAGIGTVLGLVAGFFGGRVDALLMRLTNAVIAQPLLPVLIVLAALDLTKPGIPADVANAPVASLWHIVFVVALAGWTTVARLVRGATLSVRAREYVRAAVAMGAATPSILRWHVMPNVLSTILVATTLSIGNIVLLESVLSFLGLGIRPPVPSWGNMLTNAQDLIWEAPMMAVYPGLLIFTTVICFNFVGDGLQDALDPRATGR